MDIKELVERIKNDPARPEPPDDIKTKLRSILTGHPLQVLIELRELVAKDARIVTMPEFKTWMTAHKEFMMTEGVDWVKAMKHERDHMD